MKRYPPAAPKKRLRDRLRSILNDMPPLSMYSVDIPKSNNEQSLDTMERENKKSQ